jgi:hypothetical protein
MVRAAAVAAVLLACLVPVAHGDPAEDARPLRKKTATLIDIFRGPFQSSRLFAMPTADVLGAYMMSLSGDGSLLQEPGVLTSAGVFAIGFGDIAQLEYRHTAAISVTGVNAPLPAAGVQLKIPFPERPNVPVFGIALRIGVPRTEELGGTTVEEKVTDFYGVVRWRHARARWLTLHGGVRYSFAHVALEHDPTRTARFDLPTRRLVLPTSGVEITMNPEAKLVAELAEAPRFRWMAGTAADPVIGKGLLVRLGVRWAILPSVILDGTLGYQTQLGDAVPAEGPSAVVQWDIRLGAEVFVPWGALACRATGAFCE